MYCWCVILGDTKFEDPDMREEARRIADLFLEGYTYNIGHGRWKGMDEVSLSFEYLGSVTDDVKILSFARALLEKFEQQEVLVYNHVVYDRSVRAVKPVDPRRICCTCGHGVHIDNQGDQDTFKEYGMCSGCYSELIEMGEDYETR